MVVMHETCTKAVKGMPQCKNSLANCANLRAVAGMSITGWKQGYINCNMAVTGYPRRNFELNVTGLFQGCYSVETALITVPMTSCNRVVTGEFYNPVPVMLQSSYRAEILLRGATFHHTSIMCCNASRVGYNCSNLS